MSIVNNGNGHEEGLSDSKQVRGMYQDWFMDYASYVILERAVPRIADGLKPVQRRILHAMKSMDDGRFNKVANIIGSAMQYHPHGDASIGDAIVNMGQKDLLIETQGNWGDVRTGDGAAAARYIEARLSKFALEVVFNPQTTEWQLSYDGRKQEPITLPVKFPLLLAQGVEGIAVGLSTRVLPHNFCELLKACIDLLKGKRPKLYPDFPTGGLIDVSDYQDGARGGRVRVRAKIEEVDKKTLVIRDIPFGTTTTTLMESIVKANDKGKIKIKQVVDNTAKDVEILVHLAPNVSPDVTTDALYAFTDCEVSISPNACVIVEDKPAFLGVRDILEVNNTQTVDLLRRELEIKKSELKEKLLFSSLEKIFIEERIYRDIEETRTREAMLEAIDKGLEPFKPQFYRDITTEDIAKLGEIPIRRISRYDSFKADEAMKKLEEDLAETEHHLAHLTEFAVAYYERLLDKYGKGRERRTQITTFDSIAATAVVANNQKLYVNKADGFAGYGLKKDEYVMDCSDIDDIIAIRRDGTYSVKKVADKVFFGKDILHVAVFNKGDERTTYNAIYLDGATGKSMVKRFQITSVTREKDYHLTKGSRGSKVLYLSANPNGEAETVTVKLSAGSKARNKVFDFDFAEIDIKGKGAGGNILTRYPVRRVDFKEAGASTLAGLKLWYDGTVGRVNNEERGDYLGEFVGDDLMLVIYKDGSYEVMAHELNKRIPPEKVAWIGKHYPDTPVTSVHVDGEKGQTYLKRFLIETTTLDKPFSFISEAPGSKLVAASGAAADLRIAYKERKGRAAAEEQHTLASDVVDVKGWKALGNRLSTGTVSHVEFTPLGSVKSKPAETKPGDGDKSKEAYQPGQSIDLDLGEGQQDLFGDGA